MNKKEYFNCWPAAANVAAVITFIISGGKSQPWPSIHFDLYIDIFHILLPLQVLWWRNAVSWCTFFPRSPASPLLCLFLTSFCSHVNVCVFLGFWTIPLPPLSLQVLAPTMCTEWGWCGNPWTKWGVWGNAPPSPSSASSSPSSFSWTCTWKTAMCWSVVHPFPNKGPFPINIPASFWN